MSLLLILVILIFQHIHFDAKYKVDKIQDILGKESIENEINDSNYFTNDADEQLDNELLEHKKGIYKRVDLLKMHAYKDVVRRTAGAYILYPGTELKTQKGFHELIPGLGAFTIKPSSDDTGITQLAEFINDVL